MPNDKVEDQLTCSGILSMRGYVIKNRSCFDV